MSSYGNITKLRENPETARVGLPWTTEEHQQLLSEIETDLTLEQIAQQHQRTPGAIQQRLLWETWNQVYKEQTPVDEACEQLCVSREAFEAYERKRSQNEERKKQPKSSQKSMDTNNLKVLTEIQLSLVKIAQQLEKMTKICDSLKNNE
jgi:hypothetical protein